MFGLFFFGVILASLLILRRWRAEGRMLSWRKVAVVSGICSLFLFPLELVFRPGGACFGRAHGALPVLVQYGVFLGALCLSVQALNCIVWYGARHETVWKPWQKWGVMAAAVLLAAACWGHWGTHCSFDFLHRQYPQLLAGQYDLMHTLVHTLMCQGILTLWHDFHAIILVHMALLLLVYFMIFSWGAREKIRVWIVMGAVVLCMLQFDMAATVIKDVPYSIAMMALTVGLCTYMLEKRAFSLWLIGLGLAGAGSLRYDGYVPFFLTVGALAVYMFRRPQESRRLAIPVAGALLFWLFAFAALPPLMKAERGASGTRYAKMAHVICDVAAGGGCVSPGDMEVIEREIMPRAVMLRQYRLYQDSMHPVVSAGHGEKYLHTGQFETWETGMKYGFAWTLSGKGDVVRKLFFSVAADNPLLTAKILLLNTQMVWNLPAFHLRDMPQLWLFYGCVLSFLAYGMAREKSCLVPFVPFYGVALVIGAAATTYEVRYLLPVELLFPILLLYSIGCARRAAPPDAAAVKEARPSSGKRKRGSI